MVSVRCREHERLSVDYTEAQREFQATHDVLMSDPALDGERGRVME
jgi:hypothetical protein